MDRAGVSKLIFDKAKKYLRISTILFTLSLILVATLLAVVENQYLQVQKDFIENDNTRFIEIRGAKRSGQDDYLRFFDAERIDKALRLHHPNSAFKIISEYQFNFGITDSNGATHFIYALDEVGASLLGDQLELHPGIAYSIDAPVTDLALNIPVIEFEGGGFRSVKTVNHTLQRESGVSPGNPFGLFESNSENDQLFISASTYRQMIELAFNTEWNTFVERFDRDNPYGIQAIRKIFVHVDNLSHVQPIAKTLADMGYSVNYVLRAFEDFAASMRNSAVVMSILILVVFLGAAAYIVLSFNSCFRVQQKDMGILKHFGYSSTDLDIIYSTGINQIFLRAGLIAMAYTLIITAILVPSVFLYYFALNLAVILVLLLLINRIIVSVVLKIHTKRDIISLLKVNKEFE